MKLFKNACFSELAVCGTGIALFVFAAVILIIGANMSKRHAEEFRKICNDLDGKVIEMYRSPDLCVSSDGRILARGM